MWVFLLLAASVVASPQFRRPHNNYFGHGFGHVGYHDTHYAGCGHSSHEEPEPKYPYLVPVLNQLESGFLSPKELKEVQTEVNNSVQKGIQAWNKREGIEEAPVTPGTTPEPVGDPNNIDLRFRNNNTTPVTG